MMMRITLGAKACLFTRAMTDLATKDCIVGLIPSPESKSTCTVEVRIGADTFSAADETWLLRVLPSDSVVPAYRDSTIIPHRTYVRTRLDMLDGDHPPRVLCAFLSCEARKLMFAAFSPFEPLHAEALPDLRYQGPSNLATVIGKELAEVILASSACFPAGLESTGLVMDDSFNSELLSVYKPLQLSYDITMFEFYRDGSAYFRICGGAIVISDEVIPGVIADFDSDGNVIGIEWY